MFSQVKLNTFSILNKLKKTAENHDVEMFWDGVGIKNLFNIRVSNIFYNASTILKMASFLAAPFAEAGEEIFLKAQNGTHYRIIVPRKHIRDLSLYLSDCGLEMVSAVNQMVSYELIQKWFFFTGEKAGTDTISFERAMNDSRDDYTESCLINFFNKSTTSSWLFSPFSLIGFSAVGMLLCCSCLGLTIHTIKNIKRDNSQVTAENMSPSQSAVEEVAIEMLNHHSEQNDGDISYDTFHSLFKSEPKSMAEKLEATGIDLSAFPQTKRYICPITREVMTHPCIADDGNSYEKWAIEKMKGKPCPVNRNCIVTNIIPNNVLRSEIMEFVEHIKRLKTAGTLQEFEQQQEKISVHM